MDGQSLLILNMILAFVGPIWPKRISTPVFGPEISNYKMVVSFQEQLPRQVGVQP